VILKLEFFSDIHLFPMTKDLIGCATANATLSISHADWPIDMSDEEEEEEEMVMAVNAWEAANQSRRFDNTLVPSVAVSMHIDDHTTVNCNLRVRKINDVIDDNKAIVSIKKTSAIPNFNSIVENLRGLKIATDDEAKSMMQYGELQWNVGTIILLFNHY